ncbi:twin-arginine translocase subunit TatC [Halorubrum sp. CBA1229]|jgi:sec-independent protein translocase protein TatC|uniref:twin-arginine translocase subunit TatC n=1 Tax=Halorubrum sp. CBA1229 TaxID=1853699 RepID=UPI000F3D87EE|nr:twin-arginine translocase subunit TatC [Halorubrum sp. CBA1229]QKY16699.1 twin-arginine translocase subunit TatC [Halorubrum sp. CBA1229]
MDDSDRSRDEPSAPEDDSVADDAASDGGGTDADGDEPDSVGTDSVDSEVSPEVTPEVGDVADDEAAEASSADDGGDGDADDDPRVPDDSDPSAPAEGESTESLGDGGTPATAEDAAAGTVEDATIADDGTTDDSFEGLEAPESDEEMPLAAHIEEMMRRLAVVFLFGGLATLVVVTESTELINYFWSYHIPEPTMNRPRLYGPLELPLTRLKVAGLAGVVVGLPAFVYQTYRFMKPGLYENERRYYLAAVPTSLVLGGIGIAFAHFLVLPAIFSYFTTYTSDAATIAFGLAETFNLIVIMLAFMAIVFQIPLFIMLAIMMNLVTRQWLEAKRLLFWGAFLGIAFLFSPDPTGMAPIIVTLTMIVLYEGTLAILRWTGN